MRSHDHRSVHMGIITMFILFIVGQIVPVCFASDGDSERDPYSCRDCNVILISLGNVGARYMSLYGYTRKTTPYLDGLAQTSVVLENLYTPASWTLPVGVSLFSSLQPYSHKVMNRDRNDMLDPMVVTFPELLQRAGYHTAAFTGGLDYRPAWGHMRGFAHAPRNPDFTHFPVTFKQAGEWISRHSREKFFVFIHGYDAHCPFSPLPSCQGAFTRQRNTTVDFKRCIRGFDRKAGNNYAGYYIRQEIPEEAALTIADIAHMKDLYDETILSVDTLLKDFMQSLDPALLAKTVVIIIADHGEMFDRKGRFGRAGTSRGCLFDEVINIPCVIHLPSGIRQRVTGLAQLIDVFPTVFSLLRLPVPAHIQGRSLLPLIAEGLEMNAYVYGGAEFWGNPFFHYVSRNEYVRTKEWKYIHEKLSKVAPQTLPSYKNWPETMKQEFGRAQRQAVSEAETHELYDLDKDPKESIDRRNLQKRVFLWLKDEMDSWAKYTRGYDIRNNSQSLFDSQSIKRMREQGYW